ncbi:hypothetical protein Tco_1552605, partial [Tanacetum coccineum]
MNKPSLVLDDLCILHRDFSSSLMGKVKDFGSSPNLKLFLANKGFDNISIKYMGGFWVLIEFQPKVVLEKFKANVGIGSWFSILELASNSFIIDERVTWIDIKGVSLKEENGGLQKQTSLEGDSDAEEIPETIFDMDEVESKKKEEYPPGFTPRDATKVNSNSVDKDSREEKECDQNCYENEEVSVTNKKRSSSTPEEDRDVSACS